MKVLVGRVVDLVEVGVTKHMTYAEVLGLAGHAELPAGTTVLNENGDVDTLNVQVGTTRIIVAIPPCEMSEPGGNEGKDEDGSALVPGESNIFGDRTREG